MSRHIIEAEVEVFFTFPGLADGDREVAYPKVAITYDYSPGCPAHTPRGEYAPIDPPEPPEVSFVSAELLNGDGLAPTPEQIQEWGSNWLDEELNYIEACDHAEEGRRPDPDAAYEQQRDDDYADRAEWKARL